jgi:uncharacterized membrane-anchored protein
MIRRTTLLGFALAFLVQAGLLGYMLVARASLLSNGTEVRLNVMPVDPRDFLRGDYVILSYPMSTLNLAELGGDTDFDYSTPVYVELEPDGEVSKPVAVWRERPEGKISIRGEMTNWSTPTGCEKDCNILAIDYNLEKFFVPEGEGLELEKLRNDQRIQVDVAVSDNGRAALKRLRVDGQVKYEETMF